ncbi:MAG: type IV pilus secretin PilQ [Magnetococcales bacterium]|nr:type IV pilus secretin PilQ [Magnetococcales bacterium]MBF0151350.1 type IV pilus secretin PilQ [Magnetococcales bacterium]MBF0172983.1 type IV pilus secretin PilQ [Magnetococcales bacterium]MBF0348279.1 type IV pilus secretin PilQ [Magnetococcales bacterium]MBF0631948.1 type IV pilus secretin PilQ [Magnetococcales bacterium]
MSMPNTASGDTTPQILSILRFLYLGLSLGLSLFPGHLSAQGPTIGTTTYLDSDLQSTSPRALVRDPALIQRIESTPVPQGREFMIQGDQPLQYKIFNLSDPPKLLLLLTNARLSPMVQPMLLETNDIGGMFPSQTDQGDVRVEIGLKNTLSHDIIADGNRLRLTVLASSGPTPRQPEIHGMEAVVESLKTTLMLQGTGPGPTPKVFQLHDPPRLVMDLTGYKGPAVSRTERFSSPEIESASLMANDHKSRLTVTLKGPDIRHELVTRRGLPALVFTQPPQPADTAATLPSRIEAINFEREGDLAVLRITTTSRKTGLQIGRVDTNLRLTLANILLPQHLVRRMDVTRFASPIQTIDTFAKNSDVQMVIRLSDPGAQHEIIETPREVLVRVRPVKAVELDKKEQKAVYTGKKISMDFKDINIHNALKLIADVSQLNIILADSVTGTLSMRLIDVPWDQALDLILAAKGLDKEVQGNVIRIAPMVEIQASAEAKRKTLTSQEQLEPFVTELIPVSFANAQDIATLLKEGVNNEQRGTRILSEGGAISIDARTSTLIIKDIARNIAIIRDLVAKLDKPTSQVLIEARVVEINRSMQKDLGISWGSSYTPDVGDNTNLTSATMVNLGIPSSSGILNLNLGTLSPLLDLDIELSALEATGKAKTISSPRVLTMDNQQASITQGENIPYNAESESGGTTVAFIEASLKLNVTPHVTPNGFIALKVSVSNNSIGSGGSPPPINTKEVTTQALVRNNETIVLGGIFTKGQTDDNTAVPGLHQIPVIGEFLFKNDRKSISQSELLIFITPRIVPSGAS